MTLNLEPIGLPNVAPTSGQQLAGHVIVGSASTVAFHALIKKDPALALFVGFLAVVAHEMLDAPASQVIAGVAAR